MKKYMLKTDEMNRIMELLFHVLDMRVTFFDIDEEELHDFTIKDMSLFCKQMRQDEKFNERCINCDKLNIIKAKKNKSVHIYQCHAGLWEGIVPLYNKKGVYLGCIFYGQLPDRNNPLSGMKSTDLAEMTHIGNLLKYLGEYISENELIRQSRQPWAPRLEQFINNNLDCDLNLNIVAEKLGCSLSYLTHKFPDEFGMSFKKYIRKKRLELAASLLEQGVSVSLAAARSGYKNQFYFSNDFKKYYNIAPLHYRNLHKNRE